MDKQAEIYIALTWLAVFLYVLATIANTAGVVFKKEEWERKNIWPASAGLIVHTAAIAYWWIVVGHGPYMAQSEVLSSDAWVGIATYLVMVRYFPAIRTVSMVVYPAAFLVLALSVMYNPGVRSLPPTFGTVWLFFHIGFYKIALGTLLIALAFSVFYLMKCRSDYPKWLDTRLPELQLIDLYAYRFTGFGFVFWGIGMLAGSIWAFKSLGRYWAWDPLETWSLITWFLFGGYLHLRRFFNLSGKRAAWFFIFCFIISLIAQFFPHQGYLS